MTPALAFADSHHGCEYRLRVASLLARDRECFGSKINS